MEGTWTASTQPHSHIPSERSTGKRLLFLNCSGIPVALHAAPFAVPRELSLIYGTAGGMCWPCFSFGGATSFSCWSWPLCGPKASCYDVKSTPLAPLLPPSPTSGLFYSFTVLSAAPGISRSSPLSHLSTSHGPVVAPRNLCWKSCNSSVSPGCIKSSPLTQPAQSLTYNHG